MKATQGTYYTDPTLKTNSPVPGATASTAHLPLAALDRLGGGPAKYYVSKVGSFRGGAPLPLLDLRSPAPRPGRTSTLGPQLARDDRAAHGSHPEFLHSLPQLPDRPPRQRHELHALPVVDRALHQRPAARPRWLAHLDVLAAHQQRLGGRHWGTRRHEPLQRQQCPAGQDRQQLGWRLRPATVSWLDRPGRQGDGASPLSASTVSPVIDQAVNFSGDLAGTSPAVDLTQRNISLWRRPLGKTTWSKVADDTTDGSGHYALTAVVPRTADYQMRWAGGPTYAPSASPMTRLTTPAPALVEDRPVARTTPPSPRAPALKAVRPRHQPDAGPRSRA